jgi:hypothetical protein
MGFADLYEYFLPVADHKKVNHIRKGFRIEGARPSCGDKGKAAVSIGAFQGNSSQIQESSY